MVRWKGMKDVYKRIRQEWKIVHIILSSLDLTTSTLLNGVATQWCGKKSETPLPNAINRNAGILAREILKMEKVTCFDWSICSDWSETWIFHFFLSSATVRCFRLVKNRLWFRMIWNSVPETTRDRVIGSDGSEMFSRRKINIVFTDLSKLMIEQEKYDIRN